RRDRGARARVVAAQHRPVPLRHRHADARGADRAPPLGRGDPPDPRRRHARLPVARRPARRRQAPEARHLRRLLLRRLSDPGGRRGRAAAAHAVPADRGRRRSRRGRVMPERGRLTAEQLVREVDAGRIETVVTALPDLYGRLVGKRIQAPFFLESIAGHGMHVCDYLLACDMEMDPTPGYAFTNWASGYGDVRCVPDLGTLRTAAWLDRSAVVLCDCVDDDSGGLVEVAPRSVLRRQLDRLRAAGFTAKMGSELEFFLFKDTFHEAREK